MDPLSEEFAEKTWQEVAKFTPTRADREMIAMGKNQPDLLAFLMAYTEDLQQEVKELAIYMAFVIYKMFVESMGKIPKISARKIMAAYDENIHIIESIEGAHEKFTDRIAGGQVSKQPYVMKYVLETLMEDAGDEGIELTEEDIVSLYIIFKTLIEVLDVRK